MTTYRQITEPALNAFLVEDVFELSGAFRREGRIIARAEGQTHARWQLLNAALGGDKTVSQIARRLGLARQGVRRVADILVARDRSCTKATPKFNSRMGVSSFGVSQARRCAAETDSEK